MEASLYKCCYCLQTVIKPLVMCHQTHVACFDCVCEHIRHSATTPTCPVCRAVVHLRFDRLILESAATFRRSKRRKTNNTAHDVFLKILAFRERSKFRAFTRLLRKFVNATDSPGSILQIQEDIENIEKARESIKRLEAQHLYGRHVRI